MKVLYVPAALALHQRPGVPGIRSTFGTGTELLNSLRSDVFQAWRTTAARTVIMWRRRLRWQQEKNWSARYAAQQFFRHRPQRSWRSTARVPAARAVARELVRTVDLDSLVPDESLSIDEGAVRPWQTLMWSLMKDIARDLGVRTDVPFRDLTEKEREIVFHGPAIKKHMIYQNKTSGAAGEMDFTYFNAVYTVENALSKVKDEKGMKRVEKFLKAGDHARTVMAVPGFQKRHRASEACGDCHWIRHAEMTLSQLVHGGCERVPDSLPTEMRPMAAEHL